MECLFTDSESSKIVSNSTMMTVAYIFGELFASFFLWKRSFAMQKMTSVHRCFWYSLSFFVKCFHKQQNISCFMQSFFNSCTHHITGHFIFSSFTLSDLEILSKNKQNGNESIIKRICICLCQGAWFRWMWWKGYRIIWFYWNEREKKIRWLSSEMEWLVDDNSHSNTHFHSFLKAIFLPQLPFRAFFFYWLLRWEIIKMFAVTSKHWQNRKK